MNDSQCGHRFREFFSSPSPAVRQIHMVSSDTCVLTTCNNLPLTFHHSTTTTNHHIPPSYNCLFFSPMSCSLLPLLPCPNCCTSYVLLQHSTRLDWRHGTTCGATLQALHIFALLGVWMATLRFGRCQALQASGHPTTGTLLGVSYEAVRRYTFAGYMAILRALLHFDAVRLRCRGNFTEDYSYPRRVIIGVLSFRAETTVPIFPYKCTTRKQRLFVYIMYKS